MIVLIVTLLSVAASITSSAINANTAKKIDASNVEIEALKLEEAELALDSQQQRVLQATIKAKSQELVKLQKSLDQAAILNTVLLVGAMALASYVAFLTVRPAPAQQATTHASKGPLTVALFGLVVCAIVFWRYVAKQSQPQNEVKGEMLEQQ